MKTNTETYKVHILGEEYHLVSDEAEKHVLEAAAKVNEILEKLTGGAETANKKKVAVMAAIQLASELLHMQEDSLKRDQQEKDLALLVDRSLASL